MQVHMLKFAEKSHFLRSYNDCKKNKGFMYNPWVKFMTFSCFGEVPKL